MSSQRRKASVEVRKLTPTLSHNLHRVWKLKYRYFVAWKGYMINVFRNEKYLVYFLEDLGILKGLSKCLGIFFKRAISIRMERTNDLQSFETSQLNAQGTCSRSETIFVMLRIGASERIPEQTLSCSPAWWPM